MALGPELVTNGDFETDSPTEGIVPTSWTQVTATGTFFTKLNPDLVGEAKVVGATPGEGGVGRQDVTSLTVGKTYRFIVTAFEADAGDAQFQVELGSTTGGADYLDFTSAGVGGNDIQQPTVDFVATTTTASITLSHIGADEATRCQFDDVSIKEVNFGAAAATPVTGGEPGNVFYEGKGRQAPLGKRIAPRGRRRELPKEPSKKVRTNAGALAPDDTTFDAKKVPIAADTSKVPITKEVSEVPLTPKTAKTTDEVISEMNKLHSKLLAVLFS